MSLKEEISNLTFENFGVVPTQKLSIYEFTDEIISKFEKRIDELLQQVPTISSQDMYSTSNLATERRTLNKVKEMLK